MANKMLIDATHPEETRVVVVRGNRVEDFDFETAHRKQLRGNIYLAKVTRVEPSLQAAFVDYGGNRHGFLAFSEIHPDYYQIPVADRQRLLELQAEEARREEEEEDRAAEAAARAAATESASSVVPDEAGLAVADEAEPAAAAELPRWAVTAQPATVSAEVVTATPDEQSVPVDDEPSGANDEPPPIALEAGPV